MERHIHKFSTQQEFEAVYYSTAYTKPWLSLTLEDGKVSYNKPTPMSELPLTFEIAGAGNIIYRSKNLSGIQYRKNKDTWIQINTGSTTSTTISVSAGDVLEFRGDNNTYCTIDEQVTDNLVFTNHGWFENSSGCKFKLKGNIMSLLDSDGFSAMTQFPTGSEMTFGMMFSGCGVTDITNLSLPNTVCTGCYWYLFASCNDLTSVMSALPATTLAEACYAGMFSGCHNITEGPLLPATSLAEGCYTSMFSNCISLQTATSAIPATIIPMGACHSMFFSCTTLTASPALPATTVGDYAYENMFSSCVNLTTQPALPATTLGKGCYKFMFALTKITSVPTLNATTLKEECYCGMFHYCTGLTAVASLPATTLAVSCCTAMFRDCLNLASVPNSLPATTLPNGCYQEMFKNTKIATAPTIAGTSVGQSSCEEMFKGCTAMTNGGSVLPAKTIGSRCYAHMYEGCTSLTTAPNLAASTLATSAYTNMFAHCRALENSPIMSATSLATGCCSEMFRSCTKIVSASTLCASTLVETCYLRIFCGCTALKRINCYATTNLPSTAGTHANATNCTCGWTMGVQNIQTSWFYSAATWSRNAYHAVPNSWRCRRLT